MRTEVTARFEAAAGPGGTLILSRPLSASREAVWRALSTPSDIAAWMGVEWLAGDAPLVAGSPFDYRFPDPAVESRGRVLRIEAPRLIEHSWFENLASPRAFPSEVESGSREGNASKQKAMEQDRFILKRSGSSVVGWALEADGPDCDLTLTHRFGAKDDAPRTAAGWTALIERLAAWLAGEAFPQVPWRALRDDYAARFGEAATRDGRAVVEAGRPGLRYVRILAYSPEAVWAMLVSHEGLALWMGAEESEVDGRVGGRFNLTPSGGAPVRGTIRRWEPGRALEYAWDDGAESLLRVELQPHPMGARVILTRLPDGGVHRPLRAFGWHFHLDALEAAMEGRKLDYDPAVGAMQQKMYAATLG